MKSCSSCKHATSKEDEFSTEAKSARFNRASIFWTLKNSVSWNGGCSSVVRFLIWRLRKNGKSWDVFDVHIRLSILDETPQTYCQTLPFRIINFHLDISSWISSYFIVLIYIMNLLFFFCNLSFNSTILAPFNLHFS